MFGGTAMVYSPVPREYSGLSPCHDPAMIPRHLLRYIATSG